MLIIFFPNIPKFSSLKINMDAAAVVVQMVYCQFVRVNDMTVLFCLNLSKINK